MDIFDSGSKNDGAEASIAFVGLYSTALAAFEHFESFAQKHNVPCVTRYTVNFDGIYADRVGKASGSVTDSYKSVDFSGVTLSNAENSILIAGWCVTPEGIKEYKYRIIGDTTKVDIFLENPANGGSDPASGIFKRGIDRGFGDSSTIGASFQKPKDNIGRPVNLSGFEGQTVTVELFAVSAESETEILLAKITNVTVPAATPTAE
jgi:hypothetical protein